MTSRPAAALNWVSGHLLGQRPTVYVQLLLLAAVLELAAAFGLSYVVGFGAVHSAVAHVEPRWIYAMIGGLVVSFVGYLLSYRELYRMADGPRLTIGRLAAVVIGTFGGFVAHSGSALDEHVLQAAGATPRDSRVRVTALGGLEHGVLALLATGASIAVLVTGLAEPTGDFSLPWAVIPVPAFALAFWLGRRFQGRLTDSGGWRHRVGVFIEAIDFNRRMFLQPHVHRTAVLGMAVFWVADAFTIWAALAAFGFQMNAGALFVGYATGMVFTRRTGPVGGAGILMLVLPVTIWYSGAPFAASVVAVFVYRALAFWLPVPFALAALPTLHRMGKPTAALKSPG